MSDEFDIAAFFEREAMRDEAAERVMLATAEVESYLQRNGLAYDPDAFSRHVEIWHSATSLHDLVPVAQWVSEQPQYINKSIAHDQGKAVDYLLDDPAGASDVPVIDEEDELLVLLKNLTVSNDQDFAVLVKDLAEEVETTDDIDAEMLDVVVGTAKGSLEIRLKSLRDFTDIMVRKTGISVAMARFLKDRIKIPEQSEAAVVRVKRSIERDFLFAFPAIDGLLPMIDVVLPEGGPMDVTEQGDLVKGHEEDQAKIAKNLNLFRAVVSESADTLRNSLTRFNTDNPEVLGVKQDFLTNLYVSALQYGMTGAVELPEQLITQARRLGVNTQDLETCITTFNNKRNLDK